MTQRNNTNESKARKRTATAHFGTTRRESHDASEFYARFPPPQLSDDETIAISPVRNQLITGDSRDLSFLPANSVGLVVTSPPYYGGVKEYELDVTRAEIPASYIEYLEMLRDVFAECHRVLEPGGRIAVNVANLGRKPYRSLAGDVDALLQQLGFLSQGQIIWIKGKGASGSCAWGSWRQASGPRFRDVSEFIIVASKGRFERAVHWRKRQQRALPWESTITKEDFLTCTLNTWYFQPESARRTGHPAPFPVELPRRLIELLTFKGDLVVDPFGGSGSTAEAAVRTGRDYISIDLDASYTELARKRIARLSPAAPQSA